MLYWCSCCRFIFGGDDTRDQDHDDDNISFTLRFSWFVQSSKPLPIVHIIFFFLLHEPKRAEQRRNEIIWKKKQTRNMNTHTPISIWHHKQKNSFKIIFFSFPLPLFSLDQCWTFVRIATRFSVVFAFFLWLLSLLFRVVFRGEIKVEKFPRKKAKNRNQKIVSIFFSRRNFPFFLSLSICRRCTT